MYYLTFVQHAKFIYIYIYIYIYYIYILYILYIYYIYINLTRRHLKFRYTSIFLSLLLTENETQSIKTIYK